ncbi:hypothetical protein M758_12G190100 [Ceratodon purpureus]|uniref:UBC core domain-containing protein n=1 Tax=Ceratodon purpureus TaxID=3225 RepID=A0A8T0G9A8_CERPU|nr:hypothetical protein KC19_12G186300 [Ceratodon purpureus]KAG0599947.1 hypothetical protein M758_12G190100 [Ceratodon purpureus]
MAKTEGEYREWANDKQTVLADLSVELDEATETHLQLLVNGGSKLQILIPSTYHSGLSGSTDSSEVFLVLTMGDVNGKVESSMLALNERLEQISVNKNALQRVLDLLLAALKKLHEHRGFKRSRHKFENEEAFVLERPAASDWEEDDEDDDDQTDSDGSEDNYQSDDEGDVNASCYDIAVGETRTCTTEFETRTRGYLHALAEDARKICEDFQRSSSRDMTNLLMWVRVVSKPMLLTIQLQFEVAGMIDERIAAGLGLTLEEPVSLSLEFSKNAWSESIFRSEKLLKYELVTASQSMLVSNLAPEKDPDDIDRFLEASGGDRHRSYGLEVLFPELTKKFFADLNQETLSDEVHLEGFEYDKINNNPFICLALFISCQLRRLPGWCLVCWKKLPFSVTRMRTCDDDLCLYRFEELGLGVSVLDEVKSNPALVDVDLSLAYCAVESSRDVFEPFPGFLLANQEIRPRSGWFSINQITTTSKAKDFGRSNKRFEILKHVLSAIPAIDDLKECANERALKRALTRAWYMHKYEGFLFAPHGGPVQDSRSQHQSSNYSQNVIDPADPELWKKEAKMAYDVTRFILMTNRLSLSLLSSENEVLKPGMFIDRHDYSLGDGMHIELTHYQFVVLHDTPEKEAHFTSRRDKNGSFFAFHGSPAENWYSILRNGLRSMSNTGYMSTGAAYGEGIYLATDLATSMGYARATSASWTKGKLKDGFQCVAICEVINGSPRANPRSSNILVVPRENERNVAIRYFLVLKPRVSMIIRDIRIEGRALSGNSNIDLLHHYQRLQQSQAAAQTLQRHTRMSARSTIFLRALAAEENHLNSKPAVTTQLPTSSTVAAPSGKNKTPSRQEVHHPKQGKSVASTGNSKKTSSGTNAGNLASRAVMQEFTNLVRAIEKSPPIASSIEKGEPAAVLSGTTVNIPDEDSNLSLWRISLHPYLLKESTNLYNDFKELKRLRNAAEDIPVELEVKFPTTFPFEPPFVRVLSPRFKMHSGHVTVGGSICMELLTASGWSPACNFESLLVQVVMAFVEGEGRLDLKVSVHGKHEYQESEAREAFQRAARAHGWRTT